MCMGRSMFRVFLSYAIWASLLVLLRGSDAPTSVPSPNPTFQPTFTPSHAPSKSPTLKPTISLKPTRKPTVSPSLHPSFAPTSIPSPAPSSLPSGIPTSLPTALPSTSAPTFLPTSIDLLRVIPCGECQTRTEDTCSFSAHNISLQCPPIGNCLYDVAKFKVEAGAFILLDGTCGLTVLATTSIVIQPTSTIQLSSINLTSQSINIGGELDLLGRGNQFGPGVGTDGSGGSYGGSGGKVDCDDKYYSLYPYEIGHADVTVDYEDEDSPNDPTFGSGGGDNGSRAGGRVYIHAIATNITGKINADGAHANMGAGSGGSVVIIGGSMHGAGKVSANGGNSESGGAGSGGRIYIEYVGVFPSKFAVAARGGEGVTLCNHGAGGTVTKRTTGIATAIFSNGNTFSYACNVLNTSISELQGVEVTQRAVVAVSNISLSHMSTCTSGAAVGLKTTLCSYIHLTLGSIISYYSLQNDDYTPITIASDLLMLNAGYIIQSSTVSINALSVTQDGFSEISSNCGIAVAGKYMASFRGNLFQLLENCQLPFVGVYVHDSANVTLKSVAAENTVVHSSSTIDVLGRISTNSPINQSTCVTNQTIESFNCFSPFKQDNDHIPTTVANASVYFVSGGIVTIHSSAEIFSSVTFLCGDVITLQTHSQVTTSGMGCKANRGSGKGMPPSETTGGGGGGYGGRGGDASTDILGGSSYGGKGSVGVGSGGGCDRLDESASAGGGLIVMNGTSQINLNGIASANGNGGSYCGGGSGGMISINTRMLEGEGMMQVAGGNGASSGGGGGGWITMDNLGYGKTFTYTGDFIYNGGSPAQLVTASEYPQAGADGQIAWPVCAPGYGNNYEKYEICQICSTGHYSSTYSDQPCRKCKNKPTYADYKNTGETSKNCKYICKDGYVGDDCLSPFLYFISGIGGWAAFFGLLVGLWCLFFVPVAVYRYIRKYNFCSSKKQQRKESHRFGSFTEALTKFVQDDSHTWFQNSNTEEPLLVPEFQSPASPEMRESEGQSQSTQSQFRSGRVVIDEDSRFDDLRSLHKLTMKDIAVHAGRVYLSGSNSPLQSEGGSWKLSPSRPVSLWPMLRKEEYRILAAEINDLVAWPSVGWEVLLYCILALVLPPHAQQFLAMRRRKRAKDFINFLSQYDHSCFRSSRQRGLLNSLKVNVSPDMTLAYIDFLFDEGYESACCPNNAIGQPKLPNAYRFAGLGSYFCPYMIDTNDILLQAISQCPSIKAFIDEVWIQFINDFNVHLKMVRRTHITEDLSALIKKLRELLNAYSLGELNVNICAFVPPPEVSPISNSPHQSSHVSSPHSEDMYDDFNRHSVSSTHSHPRRFDHENSMSVKWTSGNSPAADKSTWQRIKSAFVRKERQLSTDTDVRLIHEGCKESFQLLCHGLLTGKYSLGIIAYHPDHPPVDFDGTVQKSHDDEDHRPTSVEPRDAIVSEETAMLSRNAIDTYGARAAELEKYYKILRTADKSQAGQKDEATESKLLQDPPSQQQPSPPQLRQKSVSQESIDMRHVDFRFEGNAPDASISRRRQSSTPMSMTISSSGYLSPVIRYDYDNIEKRVVQVTSLYDDQAKGPPAELHYPSFFLDAKIPICERVINFIALLSSCVMGRNIYVKENTFDIRRYRFILLALNILDVVGIVVISILFWCLWENSTQCHNHTAFVLSVIVWPGAILIAPLSGILATYLKPNILRVRIYNCWSHLALVSLIVMVLIYVRWLENAPHYTAFVLAGMFITRLLQFRYADRYICSIYQKRTSRGWDGLSTSLVGNT